MTTGVPFIITNTDSVAAIGMCVVAFGMMCIVGLIVHYQMTTGDHLKPSVYGHRSKDPHE